jgi:hypothetical protein
MEYVLEMGVPFNVREWKSQLLPYIEQQNLKATTTDIIITFTI